MSGNDLLEKENEGGSRDKEPENIPEKEQGLLTPEEPNRIPYRQSLLNKKNSFLSKKSTKLLFFGGGGVGFLIIGAILITMFIFGSLKLVHLAEHITAWNTARTARSWRLNIAKVTEEQIATETMDETSFNKLKARFGETKAAAAVEKINSYRPKKVLANMNAQSTPVFKEVGERKFLKFLGPRQEFVGWEIDGAVIEKTNKKFFHPIASYTDKYRFSADVQAAFERKFPDTNTLVRNKAVRAYLNQRGVKLYGFAQRAKLFKGLTREAAAAQDAQITFEERKTPRAPCKVPATCDTVNKANDDVEEKIKQNADDPDTKLTPQTLSDDVTDSAGEIIKKNGSGLQKVLSNTSFVYLVVVPACLIYEGSLNNSGSTIDNSENSLQKGFFEVRSTADQQKAGEITPEAVGAKNDKFKNISQSIPERRARGDIVDTVAETNPAALPQSTSTGSYSLFDAYLGSVLTDDIIDIINSSMDLGCPTLTSLEAGVAFTALEIALAVFTAGQTETAKNSARVGMKVLIENAAKKIVTKEIGVKKIIKAGGKFGLKTGLFVGGTFGLTELAKMSVLKHSNLENSGLATDELAATQADMGGNIYGNAIEKEVNYGAPLTTQEVVYDRYENVAYLSELNSQTSTFERYFATSNPSSLYSKLGIATLATFTNKNFFANIIPNFINSFSNIGNLFSVINSPKVSAATTISGAGEYNIVQWGYTQEESNIIETNEEYAPMINEMILGASNRSDEIEDKYGKCFTETNGKLLAEGWIQRNDDGSVISDKGDCAPNNLGLRNADFGDLVFRWRLAKRYDNTLNHLKEMQDL